MSNKKSDDEYLIASDDSNCDETFDCYEEIDGSFSSKRPRRNIASVDQYEAVDSEKWTLTEKREFLHALKDFGTQSLLAISSRVPSRSPTDIKDYMTRKYREWRSYSKDDSGNDKISPIDTWIALLCKNITNEEYKFKYASRVLKYIALFEERSEENEACRGVNLTDLYLTLSALLGGEGPQYMGRESSYFLYDTFQKFAKDMQSIDETIEKKHLSHPYRPTPVRCYGKQRTTSPLDDVVINPLKISIDVLKK